MNLKALRAFRLIVERGSLSVASDALGLSQPAVSSLISMLEEEMNLVLFDRSGRRLRMTEKGSAFYAGTRHILAGLEEIPKIAKDIQTSDKQLAMETKTDFRTALLGDPTISQILTPAELDTLLQPEGYIGLAVEEVKAVIANVESLRATDPSQGGMMAGK